MNISIRQATKDDAALIAEISHETFYETFAAHNTKENMEKFLNQQFTKGKLIMEVGLSGNIFLLAYVNGELAGYAKLRENTTPKPFTAIPSVEIARLYVRKLFIGKGVGKALMQHSVDMTKEKSYEMIWLGVWQENHQAIKFYTQWGFKKFAETLFLLGDDIQKDWLMKKKLK